MNERQSESVTAVAWQWRHREAHQGAPWSQWKIVGDHIDNFRKLFAGQMVGDPAKAAVEIRPLYTRTPSQPAASGGVNGAAATPPSPAASGNVCCYCDAPLSCAACGREQPSDGAPAQGTVGPTAGQLAVLVGYLEDNSNRLTRALDNPSWAPKRSHAEGDRNAFLAAANTLDQALRCTQSPLSRPPHLTVWPSRETFLGYRDANGYEMHCEHLKCPREEDCRKGCSCPTLVSRPERRDPDVIKEGKAKWPY